MTKIPKNQNILHAFHKNQCAGRCAPKQVFQVEVSGKLHSTLSSIDLTVGSLWCCFGTYHARRKQICERPL